MAGLDFPAENTPLQLVEFEDVENMDSVSFELDDDLRVMLEGLVVHGPPDLGGVPVVSAAASPAPDWGGIPRGVVGRMVQHLAAVILSGETPPELADE